MGRVVAFDVETPNRHNNRICSMGITLIDDGNIILSTNYLINPECQFDAQNIQIHGIAPDDVSKAPTFPSVWAEIRELFCGSLLVAHNAAFDLCVLKKALHAHGIHEPQLYYVCTMQMARASLTQLDNYRLPTICEYFGIELEHHNSGSDSYACAQIFCHLIRNGIDVDAFIRPYPLEMEDPAKKAHNFSHVSGNTKSLSVLSGILSGITCDDILLPSEVAFLKSWLEDNTELKGNYPYDRIYSAIEISLEDGILAQSELDAMLRIFKQLSDPVRDCTCEGLNISGKTFCLSGEFDYGEKKAVEALLITRGGIPLKNVTRKTDVLIVGGQGSSAWCSENYGTKIKKALELQEKGVSIQIVREHDIL